ncbi:MAG: hypothetical protein KDA51_03500 [Planctomycetales bacterium]|nr:hypothetical protein [Planctomycetales bacterium]
MRTYLIAAGLLFVVFFASAAAQTPYLRLRTIAGNGESSRARDIAPALEMSLSNPFGVQPTPDGSLVICSFDQHVLYRLDPSYNRLERICGTGTAGLSGTGGEHPTRVALNQPHEVQVDRQGNIFVADTLNHRVGKIDAATGRWSVVAGTGSAGFAGDNGLAAAAQLNQAYSIAVDEQDLYIADLGNHRIRHVDLRSGLIRTICGSGEQAVPRDGQPALEQPLSGPRSLAIDANYLWVVLREGNSVWKIGRRDGKIYHVAGTGEKGFSGDDGDARLAKLNGPKGITVQPAVAIYIADTENHAIRRVDLQSGRIATTVGSPQGKGGFNGDGDNLTQRLLKRPHGVCLLSNGGLLIGDSENHRLRLAE